MSVSEYKRIEENKTKHSTKKIFLKFEIGLNRDVL